MSKSSWSEFVNDTKTFMIGDLVLYKSHKYVVVHDSWSEIEYYSCPSFNSKERKEWVYIKAKSKDYDFLVETKDIKLSESGIKRRRIIQSEECLVRNYMNLTKKEIYNLCKSVIEISNIEYSPTIFDSLSWNSIVATKNYKEMYI